MTEYISIQIRIQPDIYVSTTSQADSQRTNKCSRQRGRPGRTPDGYSTARGWPAGPGAAHERAHTTGHRRNGTPSRRQDQSSDTRGGGGGSAEAKLSHTARKIRHLLTRQFTTAHALQWALSLGERSERRRYQGRNLEWLAREPRAGYESADVRVQPAIEIARSKPAAVCVLRRERDVAAAGALRAHVEARARR